MRRSPTSAWWTQAQATDTRSTFPPTLARFQREGWRQHGPEEAFFSYNLFAVSNADLDRIRELHKQYFAAVRSIVAESKPSERVVLINVSLLPLDTT